MADDKFKIKLGEILSEMSGNQILDIPGVYDIIAEYLKGDVMLRIEEEMENE